MCGRKGESVVGRAPARRGGAEEEEAGEDEDGPEDRLRVVEVIDVHRAVGGVHHEVGAGDETDRADHEEQADEGPASGRDYCASREADELADAGAHPRGEPEAHTERCEHEHDDRDEQTEAAPEPEPVVQELGRVVVAHELGLVLDVDDPAEPEERENDGEHGVLDFLHVVS